MMTQAQTQTPACPLMENLSFLVIMLLQLIFILISFLYFRNKMRKNMRALNRQIELNRKALESQKQHLSKDLVKIHKSLRSPAPLPPERPPLINLKPHLFAILSLPKCGGSTVAATLKHSFPKSLVRHWHIYSPKAMQRFADEAENSSNDKIRTAMLQHLGGAVETRGIIDQLDSKDINFIAGVREPISLAVSLFFEQGLNYGGSNMDSPVDEIQKAIETPGGIWWFDLFRLDRWFDEDLLTASGHDVLAEPFAKNIGYKTFRGGRGDLSVYRLENFDSILGTLSDALEVPEILLELKKANIASDKKYADRYREVLSEIRFSDPFIEGIYQTRYATHFYSPVEIDGFKSRWSKQ